MDSKMLVANRIKLLREDMKMSQDEFIERLSISKRTLASYEAGETSPNFQKAAHIASQYNVNIEWLTNPFNYKDDEAIPYINAVSHESLPTFPQNNLITATKLSPHVSAGNGSNIESIDSVEKMGEFVLDVCTFKTPPPSKLFAMQVDGYSMTPMIFPDSWVVFDDTTQFKGDGLYVINWRNVLMVKLLQVNSEGMIRIVSANKDYESYTVEPDDQSVFRIFGKVLRTII